MSPLSWQQDNVNSTYNKSDNYIPENLTESLAEMIVGDSYNTLSPELTDSSLGSLQSQLSPNSSVGGLNFSDGNGLLPAPPPYPTQQQSNNAKVPTSAVPSRTPPPPCWAIALAPWWVEWRRTNKDLLLWQVLSIVPWWPHLRWIALVHAEAPSCLHNIRCPVAIWSRMIPRYSKANRTRLRGYYSKIRI